MIKKTFFVLILLALFFSCDFDPTWFKTWEVTNNSSYTVTVTGFTEVDKPDFTLQSGKSITVIAKDLYLTKVSALYSPSNLVTYEWKERERKLIYKNK